jgi:hypothetical protein
MRQMSGYPEIQFCREHSEDGQMMVRSGGALWGTAEGLMEMIDGEVEQDILRKLRAAGVSRISTRQMHEAFCDQYARERPTD